jgi:hypothetical protein
MKDGNSMKRMVLLLAWAILMLVVKTSAASLLRLLQQSHSSRWKCGHRNPLPVLEV